MFEKTNSERVQFLKAQKYKQTDFGQETTAKRQFWKGNIRTSTILKMKHLKQDRSEKGQICKIENEHLENDNVKQDKSEKKRILRRRNLEESTFEKEAPD